MLNLLKFYANGFCHIALDGQKSEMIFRRMPAIGFVRKRTVDGRRLRIFCIFFFKFLVPTVRTPLFKRTGHTQKSELIFRDIEDINI